MRSVGESAGINPPVRPVIAAMLLVAAGAMLSTAGCGSTPERAEAPALSAGGVALPPDAEDPSARAKRLGYGPWKAAPEPEGTREQTHHSRRTHGFGID